jgi:hypothetical protein
MALTKGCASCGMCRRLHVAELGHANRIMQLRTASGNGEMAARRPGGPPFAVCDELLFELGLSASSF